MDGKPAREQVHNRLHVDDDVGAHERRQGDSPWRDGLEQHAGADVVGRDRHRQSARSRAASPDVRRWLSRTACSTSAASPNTVTDAFARVAAV